MVKKEGEHWHCENRDCGWSVVMAWPQTGEEHPRCVCGSPMKKAVLPPVFSYLDFLRHEEAWETERESERK